MSSARRGWIKAGGGAAVVLLIAGVTLAVLTLLDVTFQGEGEAQTGLGSRLADGPLLTANRDSLAICVQSVDAAPSVEPVAQSAMMSAIAELQKRPDWFTRKLDAGQPRVDIGCPSAPSALLPDVRLLPSKRGFVVDPFPVVSEASSYRVFLFVLAKATLASKFPSGYPAVTEEFLKDGDDSLVVTSGVYLAPEQLSDTSYLARVLAFELGLDSGSPPAPSVTE